VIDAVERNLGHRLDLLGRDVDPELGQHVHGARVQPRRRRASAEDGEVGRQQPPSEPFGYLAAARVGREEKQDTALHGVPPPAAAAF